MRNASASRGRRSQVSVEFFLVLAVFALVLLILNNFQEQLRHQNTLYPQQENLVNQIALLAGEAFAQNETVAFDMPCIYAEGKAVPVWVYGGTLDDAGSLQSGTEEITLLTVVYAKSHSIKTVYPVTANPNPLAFECAGEKAGTMTFSKTLVGSEEGIVLSKS